MISMNSTNALPMADGLDPDSRSIDLGITQDNTLPIFETSERISFDSS